MARIDEHPDLGVAEDSGKVPASMRSPWDASQPGQLSIERIKIAARRQLEGTGRMSDQELRDAVARLVLGG